VADRERIRGTVTGRISETGAGSRFSMMRQRATSRFCYSASPRRRFGFAEFVNIDRGQGDMRYAQFRFNG
jgi:hypothetical protein